MTTPTPTYEPNLPKFKVIVAGTRTFKDYLLLNNEVLQTVALNLRWGHEPEIVSGGAPGADTLAVTLATAHKWPFKIFPADWEKHGRAAGPIRNKQMAKYADMAIVFWDGKSRGAQNMIQQMRELGKPVKVVIYPKGDREK